MADIVYIILRNVIEGLKGSCSGCSLDVEILGNEPSGLNCLPVFMGLSPGRKE